MVLLGPGSQNRGVTFTGAMLLGVIWGIGFQVVGYAMSRGRRDFTSVSQVVASRYSIIAGQYAAEAARALAQAPGNLTPGGAAAQRAAQRRAAREAAGAGPTAFGSRPDEQPRFGVRLPQAGTTTPDVTSSAAPGAQPEAPAVPEDYDPFRRPSRREGQEDPGGSTSSQGSGTGAGAGDED